MSHFGEKGHRRGTLSSRLGCKQICHGASACGVIPLRVRLHLSRESKVICCNLLKCTEIAQRATFDRNDGKLVTESLLQIFCLLSPLTMPASIPVMLLPEERASSELPDQIWMQAGRTFRHSAFKTFHVHHTFLRRTAWQGVSDEHILASKMASLLPCQYTCTLQLGACPSGKNSKS